MITLFSLIVYFCDSFLLSHRIFACLLLSYRFAYLRLCCSRLVYNLFLFVYLVFFYCGPLSSVRFSYILLSYIFGSSLICTFIFLICVAHLVISLPLYYIILTFRFVYVILFTCRLFLWFIFSSIIF